MVYFLSKNDVSKIKYDCLIDCIEKLDIISSNCDVIINWQDRKIFRTAYFAISNAKSISFYENDILIKSSNEEYMISAINEALTNKKYYLCKLLNETILEVSIIKKDTSLKSYPTEFQIETTDVCNASCIMCDHFYVQGTRGVVQDFEILNKLEEYLPFVKTIYLHGNGEPFLVKNLLDYVDKLNQYGIRLMTNTNLSVVNDEIIRVIRDNFSEINVSCEGAEKETYEYVRRGLNFENFVKNCKSVRKNCPDLYIKMCSIVMRQNVMELPKIVEFAADLGFNEIIFNELAADEKLCNTQDVMLNYPSIMRQQLDLAVEAGKKYGIVVKVPSYPESSSVSKEEKLLFEADEFFHSKEYFDKMRKRIKAHYQFNSNGVIEIGNREIPIVENCSVDGICDWCVSRPFVDLDGNIAICCINQYFSFGNLYNNSFDEIWNCTAAQNVRRAFYNSKVPFFCSGCAFIIQNSLEYINSIDEDKLHKKIRILS